jgi:hypothetical protein
LTENFKLLLEKPELTERNLIIAAKSSIYWIFKNYF